MYFRYMGSKRIALLFLNSEEIQSLERRTEWRFVNYLKKINPVIDTFRFFRFIILDFLRKFKKC